ncbi:MAG: FkbM family methyltransferase [Sphingobacteriales bacterium]
MTGTGKFFNAIQIALAKSRLITLLAIKLRNQCNRIIIERFGIKNMQPELNGEHLILDNILPVCDSFFDIGANKGDWSGYILSKAKGSNFRIFLYEPGTVAFNISLSRFKTFDNISVSNLALSDTIGTLDFYEQENAGELSSAIEKWAYGLKRKITVNTTTVDSELSRLNIENLDYVKIDTEGFDLKVIKGAIDSIIHNKIGFIQFEYNNAWAVLGATLLDAYEILEQNGYSVFLIKPDGIYNYKVREYGEFYAFSNFIAITQQNLIHVKGITKGLA